MNRKAINSVLTKVLNNWADTIKDDVVKSAVLDNTIITGGAIVSLLGNEKPKDYDVYFKTFEACRKVARYYVDKFNETHNKKVYLLDGSIDYTKEITDNLPPIDGLESMIGNLEIDRLKICTCDGGVSGDDIIGTESPFEDVVEIIEEQKEEIEGEKEKYRPVFMSPNAITLSDGVQIVIRFHGDVEEIHKNYDFVHCTNSWESDGTLILRPEAIESILLKQLIYQGSKYPVCSVIRMRKFIRRGWSINAGQILKMLFQVSELDLTDIDVLEDQLVGVDSAYFGQLIDALRSKQENDKDFKIGSDYIVSIIEKIF